MTHLISAKSFKTYGDCKIIKWIIPLHFSSKTYSYCKAPELTPIWDIFAFAWGNPENDENAHALATLSSSTSSDSLLAIEDGMPNDEHDENEEHAGEPAEDYHSEGSLEGELEPIPDTHDTTGPDVGDSPTGDGSPTHHEKQDVDVSSVATTEPEQTPDDVDGSPGMSPDEFKAFQEKYPRLAQKNPDGTQPDSQSPIHSPPTTAAEASAGPSASMPPPAPPSPGAIQRKKDLMDKLAVLRWGGCKP